MSALVPTTLRAKFLACLVALGVVPLLALSWLVDRRIDASLVESTGQRLQAEAVQALDGVLADLARLESDVQVLAANPAARGPREQLTAALNAYVPLYGVYDLIVVADTEGGVVATNTVTFDQKPLDTFALTGRSVKGEPWFDQAQRLRAGEAYFGDASRDPWVADAYRNRGEVVTFAAPVRDETGHVVRVVSTRASLERLVSTGLDQAAAMYAEHGFQTLQITLFAKNGVVLYDHDRAAVLSSSAADQAAEVAKALGGGGRGHVRDLNKLRQVEQVHGYAAEGASPRLAHYGWGAVVRQDLAEATALTRRVRNFMLGLGAILAVAIALLAFPIARSISGPLHEMVDVLESVATGDLTREISETGSDELGVMGAAVNQAIRALRKTVGAIGREAQTLAGAAEQLAALSRQMSAAAGETSTQAGVVATTSDEVGRNIQTVAAGSEEMGASIREIAKSAADAAAITANAVRTADATGGTIERLGASSTEIGEVVKVITSIAEQTNLLALNATIEAARAGEAGKGFAVVANEVKELARETGRATESIAQKVSTIQNDTHAAVAAIREIGAIVDQVDAIAGTIASAVEEQTVTTNEMMRNVNEAARGATEITHNIASVAQATQSASSGAAETQQSAAALARMATALQQLVGEFRCERA